MVLEPKSNLWRSYNRNVCEFGKWPESKPAAREKFYNTHFLIRVFQLARRKSQAIL